MGLEYGGKNDQIDFEKIENGVATVQIEVAPETTGVGFVLRKEPVEHGQAGYPG